MEQISSVSLLDEPRTVASAASRSNTPTQGWRRLVPPSSGPLVAHLGATVRTPAPGVGVVEEFAYYDGPLAGMFAAGDDRWAFECLHWDAGPLRVWAY